MCPDFLVQLFCFSLKRQTADLDKAPKPLEWQQCMVQNNRQQLSSISKLKILKLHLLEGKALSDLLELREVTQNLFYR